MKAKNQFVATSLLVLLSGAAFAPAQVNPPPTTLPGEHTMKTLQQIEPRTPIASLPYTISQPGSYYLERNLVGVASRNGITIASDNVTLDLSGFELRGVDGSLRAIYVSGTRENIVIRNGTVCQWGGDGVDADLAHRSALLGVHASVNGGSGLKLGQGGTVQGCVSRNNGSDGIYVSSNTRVIYSLSCSNATSGIQTLSGCTIKDCTAYTNRAEGILVSERCRVIGNFCDGNNYGVRATGAGNRIEENHATRSITKGFKVDLVNGHNVIVKNSALNTFSRVSDYNYQVALGNFFGPLIEAGGDAVGQLRPVHPEIHPWANFGDPTAVY